MTVYDASIPTHHESTHRSERAAIMVLRRAEAACGVSGTVTMRVVDGTYRSITQVYPTRGATYAT